MAEFEKSTAAEKVAGYIEGKKKIITGVIAVVVAAIAVFSICSIVNVKNAEKGIEAVENISYKMTYKSSDLSETDLESRRTTALTELAPLVKKSGITGTRANILAGEIEYSRKNYKESAEYYAAASKKGKGYTTPLYAYNAAVSYENAGDLDNAVAYYEKAVSSKGLFSTEHAEFSLGRVLETKGDKEGALKAYEKLHNDDPDSEWGKLAESRIIALEAE